MHDNRIEARSRSSKSKLIVEKVIKIIVGDNFFTFSLVVHRTYIYLGVGCILANIQGF